MSHRNNDSRIYVGNLPPDIRTKDLDDLFYKYGKILYIDLKNRRGPPFAFVEFDDSRDAEDAVRGRDGYNYDGYTLRVEFPKDSTRGTRTSFRGRRERRAGVRRPENRVFVSGLPSSGSWQDLKDHMREAGDICFADVYKDGTGIVEFLHHDDMKYSVRKLDDTKFRSHENETAYIRVTEDKKGDTSRSSSKGKDRRTPSYSPMRSRSRSRDSD